MYLRCTTELFLYNIPGKVLLASGFLVGNDMAKTVSLGLGFGLWGLGFFCAVIG